MTQWYLPNQYGYHLDFYFGHPVTVPFYSAHGRLGSLHCNFTIHVGRIQLASD